MIRIIIILLFFGSFLILSCQKVPELDISYTEVKSPPTGLIDGIKSYQTEKAVIKDLGLDPTEIETIEDSSSTPDDRRPRFDIKKIEINYEHLGYDGKLQFYFFNNRLMQTMFFPKQYDKYVEKLRTKPNLRFNDKRKAKIPPYTQVWLWPDRDRRLVAWSDIRLDKEFDLWIMKYS